MDKLWIFLFPEIVDYNYLKIKAFWWYYRYVTPVGKYFRIIAGGGGLWNISGGLSMYRLTIYLTRNKVFTVQSFIELIKIDWRLRRKKTYYNLFTRTTVPPCPRSKTATVRRYATRPGRNAVTVCVVYLYTILYYTYVYYYMYTYAYCRTCFIACFIYELYSIVVVTAKRVRKLE